MKEAAELLDDDAPPLFVGDVFDKNAPNVEDLPVYKVQSSNLDKVVDTCGRQMLSDRVVNLELTFN